MFLWSRLQLIIFAEDVDSTQSVHSIVNLSRNAKMELFLISNTNNVSLVKLITCVLLTYAFNINVMLASAQLWDLLAV